MSSTLCLLPPGFSGIMGEVEGSWLLRLLEGDDMGNGVRSGILGLVFLGIFSNSLWAQERWVYRHNGPANGNDEAWSVVVGEDSTVYAAGASWGSGTSCDFVIVSLTSQGAERWIYRYNGPGNSSDLAYSIALGIDGNLYAAGSSVGSSASYDFVVASVDTSGGERWVYRYNGPGNGYDEARWVAVGGDSSLYVAGKSMGWGTDYDLTVVSLTPQGDERWTYRYNGPDSLADRAYSVLAAADNNLYVPGYSAAYSPGGPNEDFLVVSLTPQGGERWVYRYNGPGDGDDWATLAALGKDGNLYVAGRSHGGASDQDFMVISFTPLGGERWIYRYNGPGNGYDEALAIVAGIDSNLYVGGLSTGVGTLEDLTIVSLTPQRGERWVYRYDGPGGDQDDARSLVLGRTSNLYAAGGSEGSGSGSDFIVVDVSLSGTERWIYRYDGPGNSNDWASSMNIGVDDNLYVAGYSTGNTTSGDFTVISLTTVGVEERRDARRRMHEARPEVSASPIPSVRGVKINYSLPKATEVRLTVYDSSGRLTRHLVDAWEEAGSRSAFWNCEDERGDKVASGTYFALLKTPGASACQRLAILDHSPSRSP